MQAESDSALKGLTTDSARGPVITITIFDENKVMTVKEVGDIGIPEFAKMYSVSPQPSFQAVWRIAVCRVSHLSVLDHNALHTRMYVTTHTHYSIANRFASECASLLQIFLCSDEGQCHTPNQSGMHGGQSNLYQCDVQIALQHCLSASDIMANSGIYT